MSEADHWRLHACASALGAPESAQVTRSRPSGIMRDAPCATHEGGEWLAYVSRTGSAPRVCFAPLSERSDFPRLMDSLVVGSTALTDLKGVVG